MRLPQTLALGALAVLLVLLLLGGDTQLLTGDEPRYLMYSSSIFTNGRYVMTLSDWQQLYLKVTHIQTAVLPAGEDKNVLMNGVYLPTLLSPVAHFFALSGLRAVTLAIGLVGLFFFHRLCRTFSKTSAPLIATALVGFSIPLLPYLHIFYMETFLFALICCGWERVQRTDRTAGGDTITAILLLVIPFVQMRGSVVAAALYLLLIWQNFAAGRPRRAIAFGVLAAMAAATLVATNLAIYGSVTGPVNSARPPSPLQWFGVIAMQLFNVRHGLFAYAPLWLLGYAGLAAGTLCRSAIPRQGLVLAAVAAVTSVGTNPGECWPGRFWVLAMPMLGVGFCYWWDAARNPLGKAVGVILIAFTLTNSVLFFSGPNDFLENRQSTKTYQMLYDRFGHVDFGLVLPVELDDQADRTAARNMAIAAGLFILSITASAVAKRRRSLYLVPAVLLIAAAIDLARVRTVPANGYETEISSGRLSITVDKPIKAGYIQFGHEWQIWSAPPNWPIFDVTMVGSDGGQFRASSSADQVIPLSCAKPLKSITIENADGFDIGSEANYRLAVYRSDSVLRNLLGVLRNPC